MNQRNFKRYQMRVIIRSILGLTALFLLILQLQKSVKNNGASVFQNFFHTLEGK
jgi:hypothetical protein